MQGLINEVGAVCVKLPIDVCPTSSADHRRYLCIVMDSRRDPKALGSELPFLPHYEAISRVCLERAVLIVDGSLRVQRRRMEPDAYIRRWRRALDEAIEIDQLRSHVGLQAVAKLQLDAPATFLAARPRWVNPPYPTPAALIAARSNEVRTDGGRITMEIDLAAPNGARDAWWLHDWLRGGDGECTLCISPVTLARSPRPAAMQEMAA